MRTYQWPIWALALAFAATTEAQQLQGQQGQQQQGQAQQQASNSVSQSNTSSGAIAGTASNNQGITINGGEVPTTTTLRNVPALGSIGLTTTLTETCMGSAGGQAVIAGFGVGGGKTYVDWECVRRLHARDIRARDPEVAKEILCGSREVWDARERVALATNNQSTACYGPRPRNGPHYAENDEAVIVRTVDSRGSQVDVVSLAEPVAIRTGSKAGTSAKPREKRMAEPAPAESDAYGGCEYDEGYCL